MGESGGEYFNALSSKLGYDDLDEVRIGGNRTAGLPADRS